MLPTKLAIGALLCLGLTASALSQPEGALTPAQAALVRQAAWGDPPARKSALDALRSLPATAERVRQVEALLQAGRSYPALKDSRETLTVAIGAERQLKVNVLLPKDYDPAKRYPLMVGMGGGPQSNEKAAKAQAAMMLAVWTKPCQDAGWIAAAVEDVVSLRKSEKPLRYAMLQDDQFRAVLAALVARYAIDPNRIHATGVSLGANYATAYAAAHPDWFAGIVPVSTEGESREAVLRNLRHVSVYVLEGAKDKNIRTIDGPRKQAKILDQFGYRHRYEEEANRGHEGFFARYPAVLPWLLERPRPPFPKHVSRSAHPGIVLPARRCYWLEADTHQAVLEAVVQGNTIDVQAARARQLTLHLSDRLVNLAEPVVVRVNGKQVHAGRVERSLVTALEEAALLNDTERCATARLTVEVPDLAAGETWLATRAPQVQPAPLPFWEDYAATTWMEERLCFPAAVELERLQNGLAAARVVSVPPESPLQPDDLVLEFDGEPFFAAESLAFLHSYLWRTRRPEVCLQILRAGQQQEIVVPLR